MIHEIGENAGMVWQYLSENGPTKLGQLPKALKLPANKVHQAIGWLAREDKLHFSKKGNSVSVSLK